MTRISLEAQKAKKEARRAIQYPRPEPVVVKPVVAKKAKKSKK